MTQIETAQRASAQNELNRNSKLRAGEAGDERGVQAQQAKRDVAQKAEKIEARNDAEKIDTSIDAANSKRDVIA